MKIISYISSALLALLIGMFLAQTFQIVSIARDVQSLSHEVATLRAEQEYIAAQIEGQALQSITKEKLSTPAVQSKVESLQELTPRGTLHNYYNMPLPIMQGGCDL